MERTDLEGLSREALIEKAEGLGVARARSLTMPELVDEILLAAERRTGVKPSRGWFGRARDLLTSVIDRGLALPTSGQRRSGGRVAAAAPPPLPTVTLAEIYAAQGHLERAIGTLREVLARSPDHAEAKRLMDQFTARLQKTRPSSTPPPPAVVHLAPVADTAQPDRSSTVAVGRSVEVGGDVALSSGEAPAAAPTADESLVGEPLAFDADEVVAVAVDPGTVFLYWEVRPKTFAAARVRNPSGALVVRVVAVSPRASGPSSEARDIRVDALSGELFVRDLPPNAQVRISVGYLAAGDAAAGAPTFEPFAVGMEIATPRAAPAGHAAQTFRRFSDVRAELAEPTWPGPGRRDEPQHASSPSRHAASGAMPQQSYDHLGPLPPASWIEPGARLVHVAHGPGLSTTSFHTRSGSSDIFRTEARWSRAPYGPWESSASHALRPATP